MDRQQQAVIESNTNELLDMLDMVSNKLNTSRYITTFKSEQELETAIISKVKHIIELKKES